MNERRMQFRVGFVVLLTVFIGCLLVTLNSSRPLGWVPWGTGQYHVTVELDEAPGVGPNAPVRRNGILIGRVEDVRDADDKVQVVAKIDADKRIAASDLARINVSMLGDSTVDFSRGPGPRTGEYLQDGAVVEGVMTPSPIDVFANLQGDVRETIISLGNAGDEVAVLAERVNAAFGDEGDEQRLARLLDKMDVAMDDFSSVMRSMDDLVGDPQARQDFKEAVTEVRDTMREARETLDSMEGAVASAERNLQNLEGLTEPLGERGQDITDSIVSGVEGIDRLLEEVTVLTRAITSTEGTIGLLLRERRLYDNLNQLIVNTNVVVVRVNDIVRYLNERVPPIVEDARVFLDKVAREPGRLIGGALNRGPGVK